MGVSQVFENLGVLYGNLELAFLGHDTTLFRTAALWRGLQGAVAGAVIGAVAGAYLISLDHYVYAAVAFFAALFGCAMMSYAYAWGTLYARHGRLKAHCKGDGDVPKCMRTIGKREQEQRQLQSRIVSSQNMTANIGSRMLR